MKNFLVACLAAALSFFAVSATAQNVIVLQHGTISRQFTSIQTAIDSAVNNDVLYLPGGSFPSFTLNKKLTLIGAGYSPDSTFATGQTVVAGMTVTPAASSGTFVTGILFSGQVVLQTGLSNVSFQRCHMVGGFNCGGNGSAGSPYPTLISIRECILAGNYIFQNGPITNSQVANCILNPANYIGSNEFSYYSEFKNCIVFTHVFLGSGGLYLTFTNCVGKPGSTNYPGSNNIFNNNINIGVNGTSGSNSGSGNFLNNESFQSLFVSETNNTFDYSDDLHLISATYNTGGSNGTPIGLYGGPSPWKVGGLPFNPHISISNIGSQTNSSGNLPVNIVVRAQGN